MRRFGRVATAIAGMGLHVACGGDATSSSRVFGTDAGRGTGRTESAGGSLNGAGGHADGAGTPGSGGKGGSIGAAGSAGAGGSPQDAGAPDSSTPNDASVREDAATEPTIDAASDAYPAPNPYPDLGNFRYFTPVGLQNGDFFDIAADEDGSAWVTIYQSVGHLTASGDYQTFVPVADAGGFAPSFIIPKPGGGAWFAMYDGHIGSVDVNTGVTISPVRVANTALFQIALAPGGMIWFAEPGGQHIGYVDTSTWKVTTLSATPAFVSYHGDILATNDVGDVRYTPFTTVNGTSTWSVDGFFPDGGVSPPRDNVIYLSLAVDPFGATWLAGGAQNGALRRLSPDGTVETVPSACTNYAVDPYIVQDLGVIKAGPKGDLWFAEPRHATLGRLDPATRAFTCFHAFDRDPTLGVPQYPERLAPAKDGTVWFTEALYFTGWSVFGGGKRTYAIGHLTP